MMTPQPPATVRTVCSSCGRPAQVVTAPVLHAVDGADVLGSPWPSCGDCAVRSATNLPAPEAGHAQVTGALLTPLTPLRLAGPVDPHAGEVRARIPGPRDGVVEHHTAHPGTTEVHA